MLCDDGAEVRSAIAKEGTVVPSSRLLTIVALMGRLAASLPRMVPLRSQIPRRHPLPEP